MSRSPNRGPTVFDEATIRFFRVPADQVEYEEQEDAPNNSTGSNSGKQPATPRGKIRSLKKSLDLLSLIACRRQGVVPSQLGMHTAGDAGDASPSPTLTWSEKQHRLGLLRVLTLERARVVSELAEVLKREHDPHARQRLEHEIRIVNNETAHGSGAASTSRSRRRDNAANDGDEDEEQSGGKAGGGDAPFFVADPDEAEMVSELLSQHASRATTAQIQNRLISTVRRRSEKAVARMYRQHERIIHNEHELHEKRVGLLEHLHEREAARERLAKERDEALRKRSAQQAEERERKMSSIQLRFKIISEARKQELGDKMRNSEAKYEQAQQKQIEHLVERCAAETEKILRVQERVAHARMEHEKRREQLDQERGERANLHDERRSTIELNRDHRLERRKQRQELQQMRAQNARQSRHEQMRQAFDAAHERQLMSTHEALALAHSNRDIIAKRQSANSTPTARPTSKRSERSATAVSTVSSSGGGGAASGGDATSRPRSRTDERRKAEREEALRRSLLLKIKEEREAELLDERRMEAEAARRVRQREEAARAQHNRENLERKQRADAHRQQLQKVLVEEQEAAAAQREQERRKAERKLQLLKLDLQRQREEAQERIRQQETAAHLNHGGAHKGGADGEGNPMPDSVLRETESSRARKAAVGKSEEGAAAGSGGDDDGTYGRPAKANAQNSTILAVIGDRGKKRAKY